MSQLLVRQLQLLLVMAVLLHFGLKMTQLLLKGTSKHRGFTLHMHIDAQLHRGAHIELRH